MGRYVVTGAASGIGAMLAVELSRAGHERAAAAVDGPLEGIAHVAGVPGTARPDEVLRVNLLAPRRLTELLLPRLGRGGAVVAVGSIPSERDPPADADVLRLLAASREEALGWLAEEGLDGAATFDLCRRALVVWARELAATFTPSARRVCTVSPGPVETPMLDDFRRAMAGAVEQARSRLTRHAVPEEVAHAIAFLLSGRASWVTGVDLPVDGGLLALRAAAAHAGES